MHSFATPHPVTLEIRNASGEIDISLVDADQTTVDVTLAAGPLGFVDELVRAFGGRRGDPDAADRPREPRWWAPPSGPEAADILDRVRVEVSEHSDTATVIVDTDPASRGWRTAFAIRVSAPRGSGVRVVSQSADTVVSGTASQVDIRTASGDVAAGETTGDVRIHTASGDVRLASAGGALWCRSASGNLSIGHIRRPATLHTTSGRVEVESAGADLQVRTVSGDVRVLDLRGGATTVTAVSGDVELGVHPGVRAAVDLASVSGDTRSDLAVTDEPLPPPETPTTGDTASPAATADSAESHPGDAAGDGVRAPLSIQVRTTSGDIRLRRSSQP